MRKIVTFFILFVSTIFSIIATEYTVPSVKEKLDFVSPLNDATIKLYKNNQKQISYDGRFGEIQKQNKKLKTDKFHLGIDLTTENDSDPILAVQDGVITDVWYEPGRLSHAGYHYKGNAAYGGLIAIDHNNGITTLYGRLGAILVKEGQQVKKGDIIGYITRESVKERKVGNNEIGYHLHFEILINPFHEEIEKLGIFNEKPQYTDVLKNKNNEWLGLSSEFGYRNKLKNASGGDLTNQDFHRGNDITTTSSKAYIYSILPGTVEVHYVMNDYVKSEFQREGCSKTGNPWIAHSIYGGFVVLKHSEEIYSLYAHMDYTNSNEISETSSTLLPKGTFVGLMGSTGLSTGPHLHFSMMIDPKKVIDFDNHVIHIIDKTISKN